MCLDGNRRPAVEILINTRHIAELIQQGEVAQVREAIEKSLSPGSQTFEQALLTMIQQGIVGQDEALANADSPTNLYWQLNNSQPTSQGSVASEPESAKGATFTEFTLNK